jgi:hypothetical protein
LRELKPTLGFAIKAPEPFAPERKIEFPRKFQNEKINSIQTNLGAQKTRQPKF